jgi:hypothetical protein
VPPAGGGVVRVNRNNTMIVSIMLITHLSHIIAEAT